ncbi:MAG TPA: hypothetical protein VHE61_10715 [Opitutaceae bacterium]|nr:hypothetical protein [Opitutaceae bacterium]
MNGQEQLTEFCRRLGAAPAQASLMATQLLKRAHQLAAERHTTPEAELGRLLELMTKGNAGEVPKDFVPPPPKPPA